METIRWNITVSKETDLALRTLLGSPGMRRGELSKFVESAVRAQVFHRIILDIKQRNSGVDAGSLMEEIDQTIHEVRADRQRILDR